MGISKTEKTGTFTVFAYGTSEKHEKTKNIISQFINACGSEHMHIDGPDVLGFKVKKNTDIAVQGIKDWLLEQPKEDTPLNINLAGFSRGAVTCTHIANELDRFHGRLKKHESQLNDQGKLMLHNLERAKLNVFAVDPVAGLKDKANRGGRKIPGNVNEYVELLAIDEMRRDFKPQDMTRMIVRNPETKFSMLPMYGNHTDSTKIKDDGMKSGPELAWHFMFQFLSKHGTTFNEGKIPPVNYRDKGKDHKGPISLENDPSALDLLKLYDLHHKERENYLDSGLKVNLFDGTPIPRAPRSLNDHLEFYVKDSDFFVNRVEREVFKVAYPKVFNYFFEHNQADPRFPNDSASSKEAVAEEFKKMIKDFEPDTVNLLDRLQQRGIVDRNNQLNINQPQGSYALEPCSNLQQLYPDKFNPTGAKEDVEKLNQLQKLEDAVNRMCFRYQREKSEFAFNHERAQSGLATELREEVYRIVGGQGTPDEKMERILNAVENQYTNLATARSRSEFTSMCKSLLEKNGRQYNVENSLGGVVLADTVHGLFSLVKETINFVGNFGYLGGAVLGGVGMALQSIGERVNNAIGDPGYNPLKITGVILASIVEAVGFGIKHSFGVKPLFELISSGVAELRDVTVRAIGPTTIEPKEAIQTTRNFREQMKGIQRENAQQTVLEKEEPSSSVSMGLR